MIYIIDKKNCCGCNACASICPKQCITMKEDCEGFLYPHVDNTTCIECGLCEKVCNEIHPYEKRVPKQVLAAINKNIDVRMKSSSGGMFYILAEKTIKEGGIVFGACFDADWQVVITYAEDLKGIEAFMGSKYVQARIGNAYKDVKKFLLEGRKVLFSGTPCQVAGLHKFLRKSYDNLLTVDFVCHGTPSPKVWNLYLKGVLQEIKSIHNIEFRNKKNGWKNFNFNLVYDKNNETVSLLSPASQNHYMKAFLQDIILRPSCYDCKVKELRSQSDITIADFWGIEKLFPNIDDDKGTSLVFINTDIGANALDFTSIEYLETEYDKVKNLNKACIYSSAPHPKRDFFFDRLNRGENLIKLIEICTKPSLRYRIKQYLSGFIHLVHNGGGKNKYYNQIEDLHNMNISSIYFRNKQNGWRAYCVEITLKEYKKVN